jgi:hypothetical protein
LCRWPGWGSQGNVSLGPAPASGGVARARAPEQDFARPGPGSRPVGLTAPSPNYPSARSPAFRIAGVPSTKSSASAVPPACGPGGTDMSPSQTTSAAV